MVSVLCYFSVEYLGRGAAVVYCIASAKKKKNPRETTLKPPHRQQPVEYLNIKTNNIFHCNLIVLFAFPFEYRIVIVILYVCVYERAPTLNKTRFYNITRGI